MSTHFAERLGNAADRPVIIGAGLAGLSAALALAPQPVLVLAAAPLGEQAASAWAQGGLAAAIGADDSTELHLADTLAAGAGLVDEEVARRITAAGPAVVEQLLGLGARFDRTPAGEIALGLEAGHCRRRIVHAQGDSSGREILRAVIEAALAAPHIEILAPCRALRLLTRNGAVSGLLVQTPTGQAVLPASRVVLATGGVGGLFSHTTNPLGANASGLMLAAGAGAALADLEFVQFHPTALDAGLDPMPLISEAVRGEGAVLINDAGERFMAGQGRAELEPRDIVSRAVWAQIEQGRRVFLDATSCLGAQFATRFPAIAGLCQAAGINPATTPIPVRPAVHYFMGGVAVDARGRSTIPGLWACGEAARTGLHGANRLASNSLLEAAVTGAEVAADLAGTEAARPAPLARLQYAAPDAGPVRAILGTHAGVRRNEAGLRMATAELLPLAQSAGGVAAPARLALMMVTAMRRRQESRGGHFRTDFPQADAAQARSLSLSWAETLALAASLDRAAQPAAQSRPGSQR